MKKYILPTGFLFVDTYSKGKLETLSIGDYGKSKNIKADFLGHTKEINGVPNGDILPIQEKWVVTLSTQYGCVQTCKFCDVPNIKFRGNVSFDDLYLQLYKALSLFENVGYTDRLNIHFARMGEPIFNKNVFEFTRYLQNQKHSLQNHTGKRIETIHPVLTTMCPRYKNVKERLKEWVDIKNRLYHGQAGLQLSINTTNETQRKEMFGGDCLSLEEISDMVSDLDPPLGRKYCLNFAYSSGMEINGEKLKQLFNPDSWMVKITPIHNNKACKENNYTTIGGYQSYEPYREPEMSCIAAGFDVIVFIPSQDEEDSLITCGNAILGGSQIKVKN